MLGGLLGVIAPHRACAADIRRFLGPMSAETYRTPDLLILCTQRRASKFLFRARESDGTVPLDGVYFRRPGDKDWSPWLSADPPLPPLSLDPFAGRFLALHAACVWREDLGGVLFAGTRGAGKTTMALALARRHGFDLLTDETAFLRVRSVLVEPFPRALGVFKNTRGRSGKVSVRADRAVSRVRREACVVRHAVFLKPCPDGRLRIRHIDRETALAALLTAARRSGVEVQETVISLFELVRSVREPVEISHSGYDQLSRVPEMFLEFIAAG